MPTDTSGKYLLHYKKCQKRSFHLIYCCALIPVGSYAPHGHSLSLPQQDGEENQKGKTARSHELSLDVLIAQNLYMQAKQFANSLWQVDVQPFPGTWDWITHKLLENVYFYSSIALILSISPQSYFAALPPSKLLLLRMSFLQYRIAFVQLQSAVLGCVPSRLLVHP